MAESLYDDPSYPRFSKEEMLSALGEVGGMTGQIRPVLGQGPLKAASLEMLRTLQQLKYALPGFSSAMNRLPDVAMRVAKLPDRWVGSYQHSLGPAWKPQVTINPEMASYPEPAIHELLHHWYSSLPLRAQKAVEDRTMGSLAGLKHFEKILNQNYDPAQHGGETSVRLLTERLVDKILKQGMP